MIIFLKSNIKISNNKIPFKKLMKIVLIVSGARSGNEFFLSLLDNHSQIMQFPGALRCNDTLLNILSNKKPDNIVKDFIYHYKHFFDSRVTNDPQLSNPERHYELGPKKNQFYTVDEEKFSKFFLNFHKKKSLLKNYLYFNLISLHKAYILAANIEIKNKKILIINSHIISYTRFLSEKILYDKKFDIIHTTRHPLSAISSSLNNFIKYKSGKYYFANSIYYNLNIIINGIRDLMNISKNVYLIRLESLHLNNYKVMNDFCNFYNLKQEKSLTKSTFMNLLWWGDKLSIKNLNGINKKFKIKYDKNNFYDKDFGFFKNILNDFLLKYNYYFEDKNSNFFKNLLPLKCEIITWNNTLRHKNLKHIILVPYFYLKRIIFINFSKNSNFKYPKVFGEIKKKINL